MPKIMLDAGHYGEENKGVVKEYSEAVQMWKLHKYLRDELLLYGFEVGLTRADQKKDLTPYERGQKSKGYDLFVSLHSNSVSNSPSTQRVVVIHQLDGSGKDLAKQLGNAIVQTMALKGNFYLQTTSKKNSKGKEYYGALRGSSDVGTMGLILEHSFHSNAEACNWLLNDDNLKRLAEAEAEVIAKNFGIAKKEENKEINLTDELKQMSDRLAEISLMIKGE